MLKIKHFVICLLTTLLFSCGVEEDKGAIINYRVAVHYKDGVRDTLEGRIELSQSYLESTVEMFTKGRPEPCICVTFGDKCEYIIASGVRSYDVLFFSREK